MKGKPPTPVCKTFTLCHRIVKDAYTGENILIGPTQIIQPQQFPAFYHASLYARMTGAHGEYELVLQLRDLTGNVLWQQVCAEGLKVTNPLYVAVFEWRGLMIPLAGPGKFEIALMANGEEVVADTIWVNLWSPSPS
jgi:hypothetical protein